MATILLDLENYNNYKRQDILHKLSPNLTWTGLTEYCNIFILCYSLDFTAVLKILGLQSISFLQDTTFSCHQLSVFVNYCTFKYNENNCKCKNCQFILFIFFFFKMRNHPSAMTNCVLCSLTLRGQLRLLQKDTERASGSQDRSVGTLIDGVGCLSATVCYRHLIAIDPPLLYH